MVNYVKLVPFTLLYLFKLENLTTSMVLVCFAPVGVMAGVYLHKRISEEWFYLPAMDCYCWLTLSYRMKVLLVYKKL